MNTVALVRVAAGGVALIVFLPLIYRIKRRLSL